MNTILINALNVVAKEVHENARSKGWWDGERNDGELIALMHSELSEALEGLRCGNQASDHVPAISSVAEEMADTIIRIMDYCEAREIDLGQAIALKMEFNRTRPHRHGGKKF